MDIGTRKFHFPLHGYAGIILILLFWYLNWHLQGLRSHWAFFPLWLGYVLFINGWTERRKGSSIFSRSFKSWLILFLISAPVWWIFEVLNKVAQYWKYIGVQSFTDFEYNLFATISFSTVLPAIFSTTEWMRTFNLTARFENTLKVGRSSITRFLFFVAGGLTLVAFLLWPEYGAAFLWMSLFLILDPINYWLGNPSILSETARGNWVTVLNLWIASIICGFFWEMWNFYAYPKWIYEVPYVDFWHIFEMPLLGYLGYLPFALELYAMYHLIAGIAGIKTSYKLFV